MENHLTSAILQIGGKPVANHPSTFWFSELRVLLTVYVDDLLASGPIDSLPTLWDRLASGPIPIALGEPEDLNRFLGRNHHISTI